MRWIRLLLCVIVMNLSAAAFAAPPLVHYQGRLTDTSGSPVTGQQIIEVRLWDHPTDAAPEKLLYGPQVFPNVHVENGLFNLVIGPEDDAGKKLDEALSDDEVYVGIVSGESGLEVTPRQRILSAPYAVEASHAHTAGQLLPLPGVSEPAEFRGEFNSETLDNPEEWQPLNDLSVSVTTHGRPVLVGLGATRDPDDTGSYVQVRAELFASGARVEIRILRDGEVISSQRCGGSNSTFNEATRDYEFAPSAIQCLDIDVPAGTHVYSAEIRLLSGTRYIYRDILLFAVEI